MYFSQDFMFHFLIALTLGALIGTQRERVQQQLKIQEFGGIRSFMFIAMTGFLSGYLGNLLYTWFIAVIFVVLSALVLVGHVYKSFREEKPGITSELGAIMTFLVGILCFENYQIGILVGIITALILSVKEPLHNFVNKIRDEEFTATLEFALLAFVILPLLPNRTIDPWQIINPYEIWLLVIFMLAISFIGYILNRVLGPQKGVVLTGIVGGIVSSTAVTQAMSEKSKLGTKYHKALVGATIAASLIMLVRVLVVTGSLNSNLLPELVWPIGAMLLVTGIQMIIKLFLARKELGEKNEADTAFIKESPFKLMPAIKFGIFFMAILIISELAKRYLGTGGIYLTAMVTGLADVDAFMLSMIKISLSDPGFSSTAAQGITVAVVSNMIVKGSIPFFFGHRSFAVQIGRAFALIVAVGLVVAFLL